MKTYEEILEKMKNTYFEECGSCVENNSQTLKMMEIVASELYGISCYGDFVLKQSFVQTASGEYLDKLGEIRGCVRKTPTKAIGTLCFSIAEPLEENFEIPKGTICSVKDKAYLQYATQTKAVIVAGKTQVDAPAIAIDCGKRFNVAENSITVLVNAPVGVVSVNNPNKFHDGYDGETDNELRARILRNYNIAPNGVNHVSLENQVMFLNFVYDCRIPNTDSSGNLYVYVATKSGQLTDYDRESVIKQLPIAALVGTEVKVRLATIKEYDLTLYIDNEFGFESYALDSDIRRLVNEHISNGRIGEAISLSHLEKSLLSLDGIKDVFFKSSKLVGNQIVCGAGEILSLRNVVVNYSNE